MFGASSISEHPLSQTKVSERDPGQEEDRRVFWEGQPPGRRGDRLAVKSIGTGVPADGGPYAVPDDVADAIFNAVPDVVPDFVPDAVPDGGWLAVEGRGTDTSPDAVPDAVPNAVPDAGTAAGPVAFPDAVPGAVPAARTPRPCPSEDGAPYRARPKGAQGPDWRRGAAPRALGKQPEGERTSCTASGASTTHVSPAAELL